MTTLRELYARHGSDKGPRYHDYAEVYEPLLEPFRELAGLRILEVGIGKGGSLRAWLDYFPTARIFALDVEPKAHLDSARVTTAVADQADRASLLKAIALWGQHFDLMIDDGGHRMEQQQVTLGTLFPWVRPGGLYVIEDVHTSFPTLHPGYGVDPDGHNSTYAMIDRFARTGRIESPYLTAPEAAYLSEHIAWGSYHFRPTRRHSDMAIVVKAS